jgi:hypothetical protein
MPGAFADTLEAARWVPGEVVIVMESGLRFRALGVEENAISFGRPVLNRAFFFGGPSSSKEWGETRATTTSGVLSREDMIACFDKTFEGALLGRLLNGRSDEGDTSASVRKGDKAA